MHCDRTMVGKKRELLLTSNMPTYFFVWHHFSSTLKWWLLCAHLLLNMTYRQFHTISNDFCRTTSKKIFLMQFDSVFWETCKTKISGFQKFFLIFFLNFENWKKGRFFENRHILVQLYEYQSHNRFGNRAYHWTKEGWGWKILDPRTTPGGVYPSEIGNETFKLQKPRFEGGIWPIFFA